MANRTIPQIPITSALPAPNDYFEVGGVTRGSSKVLSSRFGQQVSTQAALTALDISGVGSAVVTVLGATVANDGAGGVWFYDSASATPADGNTILAPDAGSGRWFRLTWAFYGGTADGLVITNGTFDGDIGQTTPGAGAFDELSLVTAGAALLTINSTGDAMTGILLQQSGADYWRISGASSNGDFAVRDMLAGLDRMVISAITGSTSFSGGIDGTDIGLTTPAGGVFTTLQTDQIPAIGDDVANKTYVDAQVSGVSAGLIPKASVQLATTANITLSGEQTIDGVLTSASRVLVKNQSAPEENGIYDTAAGAWSRAADANTAGELAEGSYYLVTAGSTNISTGWFIITAPTVLGTDPVVFSQFSSIGGALLKANNLSDLVSASTARTNLGLGTGNSPQFANLGIGTPFASQVGINISGTHSGSTTSYGVLDQGTIQSGVTNSFHTFNSAPSTAAASFSLGALRHFVAGEGTLGAGSSITTQVGFYVSPLVNGGTNIAFSGNVAAGTNRWNAYMAGTAPNYFAGNTGIGTAPTSNSRLVIGGNYTGATTLFGVYHSGSIQSDVTTSFGTYTSQPSTAAASFTVPDLVHFSAAQGTIGAGSAITRQYGFVANSSLTGGAFNYGFYGNIATGANRWNLYMVGTAANLLAGITTLSNTTQATSKTTGALIVSGGAGISKMVNAQGFSGVNMVNVLTYDADPTGVSDATTAFTSAFAACAPSGIVSEILLNTYIGGFTTPPMNDWTNRPSITLTGALNGASGFQAYGNINPDGFLCSVEITNKGSGYNVLTYTCNRTSASPVITLSSGTFDARIVAGVSVRFESVGQDCEVLSRDSDTQLTLTENMTFTNSDQFVFGFPIVNVDGTPNYDDFIPVLGVPTTLIIPPGSYSFSGSMPNFGGLSNVTVQAEGAQFLFTSVTGARGAVRNSTAITWNGGDFRYLGSRFQQPTTRTRYSGDGFAVSSCQQVVIRNMRTWDAFEFGMSVAGAGTTGTWLSQRVHFINCQSINPLGDGVHVTAGSKLVRVRGHEVIQPGDDAYAVVNDGALALKPTDVQFSDCRVDGGLYRGCVAIGASFVQFNNIYGKDTHGPFCWAADDGGFGAPDHVTFENIVAENLGNTDITDLDSNSGKGIYAASITGLTVRGCKFSQDSTALGNATVYDISESTITELDWDGEKKVSTGTTTTYAGSLNTDLDCQAANGFASITLTGPGRFAVNGSIATRSSTGAGVVIWPVFFDGSTEYGAGASFQTSDLTLRSNLSCAAIIEVNSGSKTVRFKLKQGGGGVTIDAGSTAGPNSYIQATRIQ